MSDPKTYEDEVAVHQLRAIKMLALLTYPYPEGHAPTDPALPWTLGQIAGLCSEALKRYQP